MQQALELDVEYALRHSLALDLSIILRTVPAVLRGGAR
jgi:lipopolysaccharide/colanic/teichoic acid biosynthesis glycosyltransferase